MSAITIQQMADRVAQLMRQRHGARGDDLAGALASAGRRLPRRVQQAVARLADAAEASHDPKLLVDVDEGQVAADFDVALRHLARRRGWLALGLAAAGRAAAVSAALAGLALWVLTHPV